MLKFIIKYHAPISALTADCSLNLHKYEVDDDEWVIAEKLWDMLKVISQRLIYAYTNNVIRFSRTQLSFSPVATLQTSVP